MKPNKQTIDKMMNRIRRLVRKHVALEKSPIRYKDKVMLLPSEIHTIQAIGKNKNININIKYLGKHFGISKSAASQMVSKLEKKGYVIKNNPAENNKELRLSLSSHGWEVFSLHEGLHAGIQENLARRLGKMFSDSELVRTNEIITLIENVLGKRIIKFTKK